MRRRICVAMVGLALVGFGMAARAQVGINVNGGGFSGGLDIQAVSDFYAPLESFGAWIDLPNLGRCWHPQAVSAEWRPYTYGHWEWTDVGWYWVSDEPWAWACYHYGSWYSDPNYGWVWVPSLQWAPAWVDWRESDDYIGWAPCAPVGFSIAPTWFAFINIGHFHDTFRPHSFVFGDTRIFSRTRSLGIPRREARKIGGRSEQVFVNTGPRTDSISRVTGRKLNAVPVTRVVDQTPVPSTIRQHSDSGIRRPVLSPQTETEWRSRKQRSGKAAGANTSARPTEQRSPTGQQQPRTYPVPAATPENQPRNHTPNRNVNPTPNPSTAPQSPTGREQQRIYHEGPQRSTQRPQPGTATQPTPPREAIPGATPAPATPPTAAPNRTPPPTGRQQRSIYSEGPSRAPAPVTPPVPETTPPRNEIHNNRSVEPPRSAPTQPTSPTGRSESRIYHEAPAHPSGPEVTPRSESPAASPRPMPPSVRETPLPSTGRSESRTYESVPKVEHTPPRAAEHAAPEAPRSVSPAPEPHAAPAPAPSHGEEQHGNRGRDKDQ